MDASSSRNVWPVTLRRKLGLPPSANNNNSGDTNSADDDTYSSTHLFQSNSSKAKPLTTHELRNYIHSSYAALTSIQRQLHRGEESYFEETYAHGNLFAGWDNIWIENPNSGSHGINTVLDGGVNSSLSSGVAGSNANQPIVKHVSTRKMPNDHRWFSSSSTVLATGDGKIAELSRPSLIDRPPTPEVKEVEKKELVQLKSDKHAADSKEKIDLKEKKEQQLQIKKMEVDSELKDSNARINEDGDKGIVSVPSIKEDLMATQPDKEEQVKKDGDQPDNTKSDTAKPISGQDHLEVAAPPAPPKEKEQKTSESENKNDAVITGEVQNDDTAKDLQKQSDEKKATTSGKKVEQLQENVEMATEDDPSPPSIPSQSIQTEQPEEVKSDSKEDQSIDKTPVDKRPAKVPKRSLEDTPKTAAKIVTEKNAVGEEKIDLPEKKPEVAENAKDGKDDEVKDSPTEAEAATSKKAPPARRTTRRTRKRKAS